MKARIYKPARHTMQAGRAKTRQWILDYEPSGTRHIDPLMGWTQTEQTQTQLRLFFETREAALSYAQNNNIPYILMKEQVPKQYLKSYADNFSNNRLR